MLMTKNQGDELTLDFGLSHMPLGPKLFSLLNDDALDVIVENIVDYFQLTRHSVHFNNFI